MHESHHLNLGRSTRPLLRSTRKEAVGRQQPVHQGPGPGQPVHRQVRLLYHDGHGEALEYRYEMRQCLEKPDRAGIERYDEAPVGRWDATGRLESTGWGWDGSGSG